MSQLRTFRYDTVSAAMDTKSHKAKDELFSIKIRRKASVEKNVRTKYSNSKMTIKTAPKEKKSVSNINELLNCPYFEVG